MANSEAVVDIIAALLTVFCFGCYHLVVRSQFSKLKEGTKRLQVLSCRAAACLPIYSFIMFLSLVAPQAYDGLLIPIALAEGYSFYCFFCLLVTNTGGADETVRLLKNNNKELCFTCCCPNDKEAFYNRVLWALFHFLWTRTGIVILSVILEFKPAAFVILSIVAFLLLVNAIPTLIIFFENIYDQNANLMAVSKFLIMKISVGLIVLQGLVVQIVIGLNRVTLKDNSHFTSDQRAIRLYCLIVLIEYVFLSIGMYISFSSEIVPSTHSGMRDDPNAFTPVSWSYGKLIWEILQVHDIFSVVKPGNSMTQPMTKV